MVERRRQHLGDAASAALPLLWKVIQDRNLSHSDVARLLDTDRGKVARLLYGDQRPGRAVAGRIASRLKIPISRWDEPCPAGWMPWDISSGSLTRQAS